MDVNLGEARLNRDEQVAIFERGHLGIDPALHADFGSAARDRVGDFGEDGLVGMIVGVGLPLLALETAELASDETDIREIDIAIDDVGDFVANIFGASEVGALDERAQIVARRPYRAASLRRALVPRESRLRLSALRTSAEARSIRAPMG